MDVVIVEDHAFLAAVEEWSAILGAQHVITCGAELERAQRCTFANPNDVKAIIRPGSTSEVRRCVAAANRHRQPLYPISRGRNWGFGSSKAAARDCVLLDLARMDAILDFDEDMAYITVEPGVSFRQVAEFLRDRGSDLFVAVIGGSPDASLVGNAVERGDGIGPYADRASSVCGLEIVLPTGELVHTWFGRFTAARTACLSRHGVGPSLDGLFLQSNLGVVTKLTVWLAPRPQALSVFHAPIRDAGTLGAVVEALRRLLLNGSLGTAALTFWNAYKLLARGGQYPWREMDGATPLVLDRLGAQAGWHVCGALYGPDQEHAAVAERSLRKALSAILDDLAVVQLSADSVTADAGAFVGVPTAANLAMMYWRKKHGVPRDPDPDRDRCGLIWLCPTIPFRASDCITAVDLIETTILRCGFEPNVGFTVSNPREVQLFVAIAYDRDIAGEDARALRCHDVLMKQLLDLGYFPSRLGIHAMNALPEPRDDFGPLMQRIKSVIDPADIMAPGRYDFRPGLDLNPRNDGRA